MRRLFRACGSLAALALAAGLAALTPTPTASPSPTVTPITCGMITVAGDGTAAYSGDGGPASAASLSQARSVALDGSGNVYITDFGNSRIRVVDSSGKITTVAGTGTDGFNSDGIASNLAQINQARRLALDASGNIYIADVSNNRIRKVTIGTGLISTVAGNGTAGYLADGVAATATRINAPQGVFVDSAGNIFIADTANNRVRKVAAAGGLISTVAGNGTAGFSGDGAAATGAQLNSPRNVEVDAFGNIYISDRSNQRVRRVDAVTGFISTVAGNGTAGYTGDGIAATTAELNNAEGIVLDATGSYLYIADRDNSRIRKVDLVTGLISTVAGTGTAGYNGEGLAATSSQINVPVDVALNSNGDLFIAERTGNRVRRVVNCQLPATATLTPSPSSSPTRTPTQTPTWSPTATPSWTPTPSPTWTPTATPSWTPTISPSETPSTTPTWTPTNSPSDTPSTTPTWTPTNSPSDTPSTTPTWTPTISPSDTPSTTPTWTPTISPSDTPSTTPTWTPTNSPSDTPSTTPTWTPTISPSETPSATPTWTPTASPSLTASPTATKTWTPTPSPTWTATATPSATPSPSPSWTPTASPTATGSLTPSWTPTDSPSPTFTASSTASPTATPTATPTSSPTWTPSNSPSVTGSLTPSWTPSASPTATPSSTASPTPTISATLTRTLTPQPGVLMQAYVYDSEQRLVKDLGSRVAYAVQSTVSAAPNPFAPEEGNLTLTAGTYLWPWGGDNNGGSPVPNGQYQLLLKQAGSSDIHVNIWLQHKAANLGAAVFFPNPSRGSQVSLSLQPRAGVSTEVLLYNVAGELTARLALAPGTALANWNLQNSAGQALASGIYLAKVRFTTSNGLLEILDRKLAVVR